MSAIGEQAALLQREWDTRPRWAGITRHYSAQHVIRLRGRVAGEQHSVARRGASRLWDLLNRQDGVRALGAVTGSQAVQAAGAGSQAIYRPGGQAADGQAVRTGRAAVRPGAATGRRRTGTWPGGWPRSWSAPRPASAARRTRSSS